MPQLSHLAIRARQTKILMVCCENQDIYNKLKSSNSHESVKELKLKDGNIELINSVLKDSGSKQEALSSKDIKF